MYNFKENENIKLQGNILNYLHIGYYGYGKIEIQNNVINNSTSNCMRIFCVHPSNFAPTTNNNVILIGGNYFSMTESTNSWWMIRIEGLDNFSGTSDIYFYNNTLNLICDISNTNSTNLISEFYNYSNQANTYYYNNIFVLTGSSIASARAIDCRNVPTIRAYNNLFVGTKIINDTFLAYTGSSTLSGSITNLNSICGSVSNLYDYDYTNVFSNIESSFTPYILKSTATNAIDKGYDYTIYGTSISDILINDITMTNSRVLGAAIDIGAYEF